MNISARNVLKGRIVGVTAGPVTTQVRLDIGGGNIITSTITSEAASDLGLERDKEAYAVIKASQVMLATD